MKGFTKICLLLSLICVCIGAVCLGAGVALGSGLKEVWRMAGNGDLHVGNLRFGNFSLPYFFTDDDDEPDAGKIRNGLVNENFPADKVNNLNINIKYGSVNFVDSESGQIEIMVDAPDKNSYACSLDGDTIELLDETSRPIHNAILKSNYKVYVTIAIPKGKIFHEVDLITNAGSIDVSHHMSASEIQIELDAGELTAGNLSASEELSANIGAGKLEVSEFHTKDLSVDCGLGSASLTGRLSQDADIECGMGEIFLKLRGRKSDYNYEVDCGLGTVYLNETEYRSISLEKEIDNDAEHEINLKCGMGTIEAIVEED